MHIKIDPMYNLLIIRRLTEPLPERAVTVSSATTQTTATITQKRTHHFKVGSAVCPYININISSNINIISFLMLPFSAKWKEWEFSPFQDILWWEINFERIPNGLKREHNQYSITTYKQIISKQILYKLKHGFDSAFI